MPKTLPIWPTIRAAYARVPAVLRETWLAHLFFITAAATAMALVVYGALTGIIGLLVLFSLGVAYSLQVYRAMLETPAGSLGGLAKANAGVYLVFFILGVLAFVMLSFMLSFLLWGAGYEIDGETPPGEAQAAIAELMASPIGWVAWAALALAGLGLCYLALRLTVFGAASVAGGKAVVFRTWGQTKGHVLRLGAIALATHILPFALVMLITHYLIAPLGADIPMAQKLISEAGERMVSTAPERAVFAALRGALGTLVLPLFLLPGHGMAAQVYKELTPQE